MRTQITILILVLISGFTFAQIDTNDVLKAYDQRMDGDVEEAMTTLKQLLEQDPNNALVHFEMARAIDGPEKIEHINNALLIDPENTMYQFYRANLLMLEAYKGMKSNRSETVIDYVTQCKDALTELLAIKPDCKEALLFMVDINASLPENWGGDMELAKLYLAQLKEVDVFYGARAQLILDSKATEVDMVDYWRGFMSNHGETTEALVALGKAQLMINDIKAAKTTFKRVMDRDPGQKILYLDIARAHLYKAMRSGGESEKDTNQFKKYIKLYLKNADNKPKLIEAWCYGWLGQIEHRQGNAEKAKEHYDKAQALMPNYPAFTAIPKVDQAPNIMTYNYRSYFTPF